MANDTNVFYRQNGTDTVYLVQCLATPNAITIGLKGPRGGLKAANIMDLSTFLDWTFELQEWLGFRSDPNEAWWCRDCQRIAWPNVRQGDNGDPDPLHSEVLDHPCPYCGDDMLHLSELSITEAT